MEFRQWLELTQHNVILIASGAYNPIHRGHIKVFYHARRYLITQGYMVVGGYIIPRHEEYIQKKTAAKGEQPVADAHRQRMIQQALQGTFIKLLPLEAQQSNLTREQMRSEVQKMHPGNIVMFVAGDDKATCPNQMNVCLQDVPGWGQTIIVGRQLAGDASSTTVRQNLQKHGDEPTLLSPSNRQYVKQNNLWGAK